MMRVLFTALALVALLPVSLTQSCSGSASSGTALANAPFWMEKIKHQGVAPYNGDASYKVFRNVKDYGAKGDGVTDDTVAINLAMSSGSGRCGNGVCPSSTTAPAIVYFPPGKYMLSAPIIAFYYTQLIGDARNPPTLAINKQFSGIAVIDADPYIASGQWYNNTNNFFRSVRNFVIDLTGGPEAEQTGFHWQVSQSTSLMNIRIEMGKGSNHRGMFMENGSGGFMGDMVINGGKIGLWLGNQQFTVRNVVINDAATGIWAQWNWGWTYQGITINRAQVGFDIISGGLSNDNQTVGGISLIDAIFKDTPIAIRSSVNSNGSLRGSLVLNNVRFTNVTTAVGVLDGTTVLAGTTVAAPVKAITSWGQGNVYTGSSNTGKFVQGTIAAGTKHVSLVDVNGRIVSKGHPQYENYDVSQFASARDAGAKGDGVTDDTAALQTLLDKSKGCKIVFLDAGVYYVTSTLRVPPGSRIVGEAWSVIMGGGLAFRDVSKPTAVVQVGQPGDRGVAEITDILFATEAPAAGAIVVQWNIAGSAPGAAGMWDSHIRLGGAAGTKTDILSCPTTSFKFPECAVAFLALHLTTSSSAYLEGTWVWTSDHDMEDLDQQQTNVLSARGILSESQGPVWMIGTGSEHHSIYQYSLVGAKNHYMGLIQTETAYYQPVPASPAPFSLSTTWKDPMTDVSSAWGLWVRQSSNIFIFGAGLYSFFSNYSKVCVVPATCQDQMASIDSASSVALYQLSTVGVVNSLSIDGKAIIPASANVDGLQGTITAWTNGVSKRAHHGRMTNTY